MLSSTVTHLLSFTIICLLLVLLVTPTIPKPLLLEKNYLTASVLFQPQQKEYVHVYVNSIAMPLLALFIFMVFLYAVTTTILFGPRTIRLVFFASHQESSQ
ncbi:hypothetical protein PIB30_031028 [Stylosanthes scabra]|uniref:Uncharacterized protein n=1 Tax=Stylosanthes scabra TaxID=79078 RepID=A0ABU6ZBW4_9FABA|nr:hypothetical protein [Stylosanthes scabra]